MLYIETPVISEGSSPNAACYITEVVVVVLECVYYCMCFYEVRRNADKCVHS